MPPAYAGSLRITGPTRFGSPHRDSTESDSGLGDERDVEQLAQADALLGVWQQNKAAAARLAERRQRRRYACSAAMRFVWDAFQLPYTQRLLVSIFNEVAFFDAATNQAVWLPLAEAAEQLGQQFEMAAGWRQAASSAEIAAEAAAEHDPVVADLFRGIAFNLMRLL